MQSTAKREPYRNDRRANARHKGSANDRRANARHKGDAAGQKGHIMPAVTRKVPGNGKPLRGGQDRPLQYSRHVSGNGDGTVTRKATGKL